jgi:hypothetical protein
MQAHAEIEVVSRDRGEEYAAAARKGAPQARQIADRYHLTDNLRDFIEEILARCRTEISQASMKAQETGDDVEHTSGAPFWLAEDAPLAGSAHLARHAERLDRYQQLIHLRDEGFTQKAIARQLGMAERTVRHWLTGGIPYGKPELRHKRSRGFDPYAASVRERFLQGSRNGLQLWRELQTRGDIREVRERCIGSLLSSSKVLLPQEETPNDHKLLQTLRSRNGQQNKQCGGLSVTRPI